MQSQTGRIVVGYDGSTLSTVALDWAAAEAQRRRLPLTVLHAIDFGTARPTPAGAPLYPALNQEVSTEVAREGADRARTIAAAVEVTALAQLGPARDTLIEASRGAELVVVGAHSHGTVSAALLGSVALTVSTHALGPVVVVRGDPVPAPGSSRPVVVGVDGSPDATSALLYAADLANDLGCALIVVSAYQPSLVPAWAGAQGDALSISDREPGQSAQADTAVAVAARAVRVANDCHGGLDAGSLVLEGPAADVLAHVAVTAQMLVIGCRGHSELAGLILGSVGRDLLKQAPVPVTVVKTAALDTR